MPAFEIRPFDAESVPKLGEFLLGFVEFLNGQGVAGTPDKTTSPGSAGATTSFRWLLDEANPCRPAGMPPGEFMRDQQGAVVGMIGYHPFIFRFGDRRLLGLGAHNFYIDPAVRMQGFFLFKRYLNRLDADFCFSTTCNANSGPLWTKCGAAVVPDSDVEYLRVFRVGPVLQESALRKGVHGSIASLFRLLDPLYGLAFNPRKRGVKLQVEPCADWERLAAIAERNRDPARLTPERSADELQWRYEELSRKGKASGTAEGIFRFSDSAGREGWFASEQRTRGKLSRGMTAMELLDVVWPRASIEIEDILAACMVFASTRTDLLTLRDRSGWGVRHGLQGLRRRILPFPGGYVYRNPRSGLPVPLELARISDFPEAYGV